MGRNGTFCPVCMRRAAQGRCAEHGAWQPHQLLTGADRRRTEREQWCPYEPAAHACPRCLGDVAEVTGGFSCLDHGHDPSPHGPFKVDELLGPSAQRESAVARSRLARRTQTARSSGPTLPAIALPEPARMARLVAAAAVVAGTLAYLSR